MKCEYQIDNNGRPKQCPESACCTLDRPGQDKRVYLCAKHLKKYIKEMRFEKESEE